ncbi:hypothetical protein AMS68_004069 [Peltaster fructicola]|uniref:Kinase n=1 Tax=Peltaster fructicola TaxID=286661 RepID=A0A6H0XUW9_9PEZI|nr:hypothetical protein AMS68_004069 [Peltaster fructicola]
MDENNQALDQSSLQPFASVAGHDGVLSDEAGEVVVKPCTQAEVDFYQDSSIKHPDFAQFIPTFMGTLTLGPPSPPASAGHIDELVKTSGIDLPKSQGKKIAAETAVVLENLEYGFTHPSVIDLKLGARLYAPGTAAEKAARLDKVAGETTTGSLNFRIAGMKVWNTLTNDYDVYDKLYGRRFDKETVIAGFKTYFDSLTNTPKRLITGRQIIAAGLDELRDIRMLLETKESRFYSASVLIVFEGDPEALQERLLQQAGLQISQMQDSADEEQDEDDEIDEDEPPILRLKLIDFAHSSWCPGQGKDDNLITGMINIEKQLQLLLDGLPKD